MFPQVAAYNVSALPQVAVYSRTPLDILGHGATSSFPDFLDLPELELGRPLQSSRRGGGGEGGGERNSNREKTNDD